MYRIKLLIEWSREIKTNKIGTENNNGILNNLWKERMEVSSKAGQV